MTNTVIGKPLSRVDGAQKVTGRAKYAAEFDLPNVAYEQYETEPVKATVK